MIRHATQEFSNQVATEPADQVPVKPVAQVETVVKIASSRNELHAAFRLVYDAYITSGLALPNQSRMRITRYHLLPTTDVFIALQNGRTVSTLTLVVDGHFGLSMEAIYGREVDWRRKQHAQGGKIAEVSCLAAQQEGNLTVVFQMMSLLAQRARRRGVAELLIAVHPKHVPFYQRFLGFEQIGDKKSYGLVCEKPAVAMAMDLENLHINYPRAHKRLFGKPFPNEALQDQPMADEVRADLERKFKMNEMFETPDGQRREASYSLPSETKELTSPPSKLQTTNRLSKVA